MRDFQRIVIAILGFIILAASGLFAQTPKATASQAKAIKLLAAADHAVKLSNGFTFDFETFGTGARAGKIAGTKGNGVFLPSPDRNDRIRLEFDKTVDGSTKHIVLSSDGQTSYVIGREPGLLQFSPNYRTGNLMLRSNINRYLANLTDGEPFSQLNSDRKAYFDGLKTVDNVKCNQVRIPGSENGETVLCLGLIDNLPRILTETAVTNGAQGATIVNLMNITRSSAPSHTDFVLETPTGVQKKEYAFGPAVGDLAPSWILTDYSGISRSLDSLRGRIVIVDFWATWCGPCRASIDHLKSLYGKYGHDKLEIVGLTWKESGDPVKYAREKSMSYPIVKGDPIETQYGIDRSGIPAMYVIGADGRVLDFFLGYAGEKTDARLANVIQRTIDARH